MNPSHFATLLKDHFLQMPSCLDVMLTFGFTKFGFLYGLEFFRAGLILVFFLCVSRAIYFLLACTACYFFSAHFYSVPFLFLLGIKFI